MATPLFPAPAGTVWVSEDFSSLAHLRTREGVVTPSVSICGVWLANRVLSCQVGGYSMWPCLNCIALMWAQMVKTYQHTVATNQSDAGDGK